MSLTEQLHQDTAYVISQIGYNGGSFVVGALSSAVLFFVRQKVEQYRARRKMVHREFLDRINVSLNLLADGKLKIRTIFERPLDEVIHNPHVAEELRRAALSASINDEAVVHVPSRSWFLLNCILNAIAERFSEGAFREERGSPVVRTVYAFWVTCEPVKEQRERKIRVFLLRKELLQAFPFLDEMPLLETEKHRDRVIALRRASQLFQTNPEYFSTIEICT